MRLADAIELARAERLYPALIVHGGTREARLAAAETLSRLLLCTAPSPERPCGACRACRRIAVDPGAEVFHPDFRVLFRDLKTATSVEAAKELLRLTQQSPFEGRGQVLVVAEAETLTPEAANSLLKVLEEPPASAPRHFLLLAPAREDLLPTLRSRSWSVYLGAAAALDGERIEELAGRFAAALRPWQESGSALGLLLAAGVLEGAGDFEDVRAERPWATAAAAVATAARGQQDPRLRRRLLGLAEDLLSASRFRLRRVAVPRILEGLVSRHLAAARLAAPGPH